MDAFFDLVQGEGFSIEEVIELTRMLIGDYRDGVLENEENKKKVTMAMHWLNGAKRLVKESNE